MKVTITTPYVSTNALYTINRYNGRRVLTKKARNHKEAIAWEAKEQVTREKPMKGELSVEVHWHMPDNRRRDLDNIKMVLDSLTGVCWEDDSDIWQLRIFKYIDKEKPRFEITIHK
jgi:Holliday junction resolvase RusA-like endonuclease